MILPKKIQYYKILTKAVYCLLADIVPYMITPLGSGVHQKVIHTKQTWSLQLQICLSMLFKYVWPFSGYQALKN